MKISYLKVSAPGRICLLGEHQDYFNLPVIAAAIDLRVSIQGRRREDRNFRIHLADFGEEQEFKIGEELIYQKKRDYLRAALNVLQRKGIRFESGWDCVIQGDIPINSGCASSSALVIAWVKFLLEIAHHKHAEDQNSIAELGYLSEVEEFNEPGGKMDHFTSSVGGIVSIHFAPQTRVKKFNVQLEKFVLADSGEKKDTTGMLSFIKERVIRGIELIRKKIDGFSLKNVFSEEELEEIDKLPPEIKRFVQGTLLTHELTLQGEALFEKKLFDEKELGRMLTRQHEILRGYLQTSTRKIDYLVEEALNKGALGAKINGSGGGGTMFAYAPNKEEEVSEALERLGARTRIIKIDGGVRKELDNL